VRRRTGTAVTRGTSERGLFDSYDGGAIFGQPQERKPGFAAGSQGPERVGKVGIKVRRVAYVNMQIMTCEPVEGPRGPMRGDAASRSRRAAVNGQGAATSTGFFPPQVVPDDAEAWRGPRSCASARKSVGDKPLERVMRSVVREGLLMKHPGAPRRERRGWAERSARP